MVTTTNRDGGGARRRRRRRLGTNHHHHIDPHPYDILLHLLRLITTEPLLMILLCIWQVIAILGVVMLSQRLQHSVHDNDDKGKHGVVVLLLPDMQYLGYTHEQLYEEFYHRVGRDGCSIYSTLALWDIFVMVPSYILLLGTLYVRVTRYTYDKVTGTSSILWKTTTTSHYGDDHDHHAYDRGYWNADRRATHLLWPIAISDWTETFLQRRGCTLLLQQHQQQQQEPDELSNRQVQMASMAVSLKWFLLGVFAVSIMERLYRAYGTAKHEAKLQLPL